MFRNKISEAFLSFSFFSICYQEMGLSVEAYLWEGLSTAISKC